MTLISPVIINGVDISDFIEYKGLSWSYRYVHGNNEGMTLAGVQQMDILGVKADLEISCIPLTYAQVMTLLGAISTTPVTVNYDDPMLGNVTKTMHPSDQSASFLKEMPVAGELAAVWDGISFRLEEL